MKIKKSFIKQLIKEEVRKVLYGDPIKQQVIHLFVKARNVMDDPFNKTEFIKELENSLNSIGVIPEEAISLIKPSEVDQNFYIRCVQIHNEMVKDDSKKIYLNAFASFPRIDHSPNIDYNKSFMDKPKSIEAYVGEPVHLYKKNWTQ